METSCGSRWRQAPQPQDAISVHCLPLKIHFLIYHTIYIYQEDRQASETLSRESFSSLILSQQLANLEQRAPHSYCLDWVPCITASSVPP